MNDKKLKKLLSPLPPHSAKLAQTAMGLIGQTKEDRERGSRHVKSYLDDVSSDFDSTQEDIDIIKSCLPEVSMIERITISLLLSPNDMNNEGISITSGSTDMAVQEAMPEIVEILKEVYKIDTLTEEIATECLFVSGSYPVIVTPETTISKTVRMGLKNPDSYGNSLEDASFNKMSFLACTDSSVEKEMKRKADLEKMSLEVIGDPNYIHYHKHKEIRRTKIISDMLGDFLGDPLSATNPSSLTLEAAKTTRVNDAIDVVMSAKSTYKEAEELSLTFDTDETGHTGYAVMIHPTSRSVVPIGDIGCYVLVDSNGRPIAPVSGEDVYDSLKKQGSQLDELYNSLGISSGSIGNKDTRRSTDLIKAYEEVFNRTLTTYIEESALYEGADIDIKTHHSILETMLWRSMNKRKTKIVFIPSKFITYFCFSTNKNGVGKSLIEDNRVVATQYMTLLYAYNMAAVKNSAVKRKLVINLDADDPDQESTVRDITSTTLKNLASSTHAGRLSPTDIISSLNSMNMSIEVNSNGGSYPSTSADIVSDQSAQGTVDTEFLEKMRNRFIMGFWISPSWVDMSSPVEFSRSIANESMLTAKRIGMLQKKLEPLLEDMVRKICMYSSRVREILGKKYENDRVKLREFIDSLEVSLPKANVNKYEQHAGLLTAYESLLTDSIEMVLGRDVTNSPVFGEEPSVVEQYVFQLKSMLIRKFMRANNILPELLCVIDMEEESLDDIKTDNKILKKFGKEIQKLMKEKEKEIVTDPVVTSATEPTADAEPTADDTEDEPVVSPSGEDPLEESADNVKPVDDAGEDETEQ